MKASCLSQSFRRFLLILTVIFSCSRSSDGAASTGQLLTAGALYDYFPLIDIIEDAKTFEANILKSPSVRMVQFLDPANPEAQDALFRFHYALLAQVAEGMFPVALVDVSTVEGQAMKEMLPKSVQAKLASSGAPSLVMIGEGKSEVCTSIKESQPMLQSLLDFALRTLQTRANRLVEERNARAEAQGAANNRSGVDTGSCSSGTPAASEEKDDSFLAGAENARKATTAS